MPSQFKLSYDTKQRCYSAITGGLVREISVFVDDVLIAIFEIHAVGAGFQVDRSVFFALTQRTRYYPHFLGAMTDSLIAADDFAHRYVTEKELSSL